MKKILVFSFTLLIEASGLFGQSTVVFGPGVNGVHAISNTAPSHAVPYNAFDKSVHLQFLYTAAELIQAGASGSMLIDSIGWYVMSQISSPLSNYTIRMKNTSAVSAAVFDGVGLTTVRNAANLNPATDTGWYMIKLNTAFLWNGSSNLLIDVCWGLNATSSSSGTIRHVSLGSSTERILVKSNASSVCATTPTVSAAYKPYIRIKSAQPSGINEKNNLQVSIFPNPGAGDFKVNLSEPIAQFDLCLKSVSGQVFYKNSYSNTQSFDLNFSAVAGIYFLEIKEKNGRVQVFKLQKE